MNFEESFYFGPNCVLDEIRGIFLFWSISIQIAFSMNFEESFYFGPFCFLAPGFFTPGAGVKNPGAGEKNPAPGKKNPGAGKQKGPKQI